MFFSLGFFFSGCFCRWQTVGTKRPQKVKSVHGAYLHTTRGTICLFTMGLCTTSFQAYNFDFFFFEWRLRFCLRFEVQGFFARVFLREKIALYVSQKEDFLLWWWRCWWVFLYSSRAKFTKKSARRRHGVILESGGRYYYLTFYHIHGKFGRSENFFFVLI